MQTAHFPMAGSLDPRLKPNRIPLRPMNSPAIPVAKINPKPERIEVSLLTDSNKENHPIYVKPETIESCDSSLAEELDAIKKKIERLRLDGARTEKMLRERDKVFELQMKELLQRGQVQREMEIEVDRLFRLKELRSYCMRISPMRTLREKEREKIVNDVRFPEFEISEGEESVGENST